MHRSLPILVALAACSGEPATSPNEPPPAQGETPHHATAHDGGTAPVLDAATIAIDARVAVSEPDAIAPANAVTYQRDIRPLLENNCVECHNAGGIGPSALDDWSIVKSLAPALVNAVGAGRMPPWPASEACHPIADSRALPAAAKELFARWEQDGFQEGNAADYVAPEKRHRLELGPPALTRKGDAAFTPAVNGDSYRCFFAGTIDDDTYISALDIVPLARAEVHHVQLHRVAAEDVASVRDQDANASGGGYPCNSAGVGGFVRSQNLFSYRPGALAAVFEPGDAVYLRKGSGLVLQVHYNTQFLPEGQVPVPDQTEVQIWTLPAGQTPQRVIYRTGLLSPLNGSSDGTSGFGLTTTIPANASHVVGQTTLAMRGVSVLGAGLTTGAVRGTFLPGEIVGMTPHAHAWASRMVASLRPSGGAEQCLIEVPKWDYNWQLDYLFTSGVKYGPDDVLHVECNFDNSAAHQPIINGTKRQPQTITFGESTLNEMCEHYLWLRFPYDEFIAANPR